MTQQSAIRHNILKEMRYISDQIGIMERYMEEYEGWDPHLRNIRSFILDCIRKYSPATVLILGSGWLLDVPLEELAKICDKIYLADICHPVQIKHKVKNYQNCELINADLTGGGVQNTYYFVKRCKTSGIKGSLHEIKMQKPELPETDYTISLNILNQLDILLVDYITRFIEYQESEITNFRKDIQENHLLSLKPYSSCIITDHEKLVINRENEVISRENIIFTNLPEGIRREEWRWVFDKSGVIHKGNQTIYKVVAIEM